MQVLNGYSVIIFPEGSRSEDGKIRRFHKGAFYLAEKLDLDILPIMIHGTDYTLSKQDKLLKDGQLTVKILPRIKPGDMKGRINSSGTFALQGHDPKSKVFYKNIMVRPLP